MPRPSLLTDVLGPAYAIQARHLVELSYAGRRIHVEAIAQELADPGGTNEEVRVYVEGVLEGRSFGRLGGTVNTFPAVARVDEKIVMTVTFARWTSFEELVVELSSIRVPGCGRFEKSLVNDIGREGRQ